MICKVQWTHLHLPAVVYSSDVTRHQHSPTRAFVHHRQLAAITVLYYKENAPWRWWRHWNTKAPYWSQITCELAHHPTVTSCRMEARLFRQVFTIIGKITARRKFFICYGSVVFYSGRTHAARCSLETTRINVVETIEPPPAESYRWSMTRSHQPTLLWRHQVVN